MLSLLIGTEAPATAQAAAAQARGLTKPSPLAPSEIAAAAPAADWVAIAPQDLLVMDLPPLAGKARRVVIQLIPAPFSQGWVGNIRKLAAAHWWDGLAVTRVQDNYVAQWGDPNGETPKAKALPPGLVKVPESEYDSRRLSAAWTMSAPPATADWQQCNATLNSDIMAQDTYRA